METQSCFEILKWIEKRGIILDQQRAQYYEDDLNPPVEIPTALYFNCGLTVDSLIKRNLSRKMILSHKKFHWSSLEGIDSLFEQFYAIKSLQFRKAEIERKC